MENSIKEAEPSTAIAPTATLAEWFEQLAVQNIPVEHTVINPAKSAPKIPYGLLGVSRHYFNGPRATPQVSSSDDEYEIEETIISDSEDDEVISESVNKRFKAGVDEKGSDSYETRQIENDLGNDSFELDHTWGSLSIELILSRRPTHFENKSSVKKYDYLVKFQNHSYLHSTWLPQDIITSGPHGKTRVDKFDKLVDYGMVDFDEPFNQSFAQVDRILSHFSSGDETYFLIKWRRTPYKDCTWEVDADIFEPFEEKVTEYFDLYERSRKPLPPPLARPPVSSIPQYMLKSYTVQRNSDLKLRDYQLEGVNWLQRCWIRERCSILADEMGLGKTIQSLTMVQLLYQRFNIPGPFLVIAPLSTIHQWSKETDTWTTLQHLVYHGNNESQRIIFEYDFLNLDDDGNLIDRSFTGPKPSSYSGVKNYPFRWNLVITTYEMCRDSGNILSRIPWEYCIIDEAHRLKNRESRLYQELMDWNIKHVTLLTGTPLQNNMTELWNLMHFTNPDEFPLSDYSEFMDNFGADNLDSSNLTSLNNLIAPYIKRRMKEDVEKTVPPKEETIIEVELTKIQKQYYRAVYERNFEFLLKGGRSKKSIPRLVNLIHELLKCCNHPYLIDKVEDNITAGIHSVDQIHRLSIESSGKMVLLEKLLAKLKQEGHRVLIFSQYLHILNLLSDLCEFSGYKFERIDGSVRGHERQASIDRFCRPDSDRFCCLLSTRAGGLGLNLTAADTVIIYDSDWNPQNDIQAQARAHRIGQTKKVKVYRLLTKGTKERIMFERASRKLGLDQAISAKMRSRESGHDLDSLLKHGAYDIFRSDDSAAENFVKASIDDILADNSYEIKQSGVSGSQGPDTSIGKYSTASFDIGEENKTKVTWDDPEFWSKLMPNQNIDIEETVDLPMRSRRSRNGSVAKQKLEGLGVLSSKIGILNFSFDPRQKLPPNSSISIVEYARFLISQRQRVRPSNPHYASLLDELNHCRKMLEQIGSKINKLELWKTTDIQKFRHAFKIHGYGQWRAIQEHAGLYHIPLKLIARHGRSFLAHCFSVLQDSEVSSFPVLLQLYHNDTEALLALQSQKIAVMTELWNETFAPHEPNVEKNTSQTDDESESESESDTSVKVKSEASVETKNGDTNVNSPIHSSKFVVIDDETKGASFQYAQQTTLTTAILEHLNNFVQLHGGKLPDFEKQQSARSKAKAKAKNREKIKSRLKHSVSSFENIEDDEDDELDFDFDILSSDPVLDNEPQKAWFEKFAKTWIKRLEAIAFLRRYITSCKEDPMSTLVVHAVNTPPAPWWTDVHDRHLMVGAILHGWGQFDILRKDPKFIFASEFPLLPDTHEMSTRQLVMDRKFNDLQCRHILALLNGFRLVIDSSSGEAKVEGWDYDLAPSEYNFVAWYKLQKANIKLSRASPITIKTDGSASETETDDDESASESENDHKSIVKTESTKSTIADASGMPAVDGPKEWPPSKSIHQRLSHLVLMSQKASKSPKVSTSKLQGILRSSKSKSKKSTKSQAFSKRERLSFIQVLLQNGIGTTKSNGFDWITFCTQATITRDPVTMTKFLNQLMSICRHVIFDWQKANNLSSELEQSYWEVQHKLLEEAKAKVNRIYPLRVISPENTDFKKRPPVVTEFDVNPVFHLNPKVAYLQKDSINHTTAFQIVQFTRYHSLLRKFEVPSEYETICSIITKSAVRWSKFPEFWLTPVYDIALLKFVIDHGLSKWRKLKEYPPFSTIDPKNKLPSERYLFLRLEYLLLLYLVHINKQPDPVYYGKNQPFTLPDPTIYDVDNLKNPPLRFRFPTGARIPTQDESIAHHLLRTRSRPFSPGDVIFCSKVQLRKSLVSVLLHFDPTHRLYSGSGSSSAGESKPKASARTLGYRTYNPRKIKTGEDGKPIYPIKFGSLLSIQALGDVVYDRPGFHSEKYIWPVGFTSTRIYPSVSDPDEKEAYTCSIIDGGVKPLFKIVGTVSNVEFCEESASRAWQLVVKAVTKAKEAKHPAGEQRKTASVSGPEYFGYSVNEIAKLIQDKADVDRLSKYNGHTFVAK